jgi:hypothetical protein
VLSRLERAHGWRCHATARLQRFRPQHELSRRSLTLPVAARAHERRIARPPNRQSRRLIQPSSTGRVVDDSKRLRSTGACSRLSAKLQTRHRYRSFAPAVRLPTLVHLPAAVHGEARPFTGWGLFASVPLRADVACRLLPPKRSTSTTTGSTELCRTSPTEARRRSSSSLALPCGRVGTKLQMAILLSEHSQPGIHGSGVSAADNRPSVHLRHRNRSR